MQERIGQFFREHDATGLVSSAACGADLLALGSARKLGIRRRIVLPCASDQFRAQSVTDRPGNWASLYDIVIAEARASGELTILEPAIEGNDGYRRANHEILAQSLLLARASGDRIAAAVVWDQVSRGPDDVSENLGREARKLGLDVFEISTL